MKKAFIVLLCLVAALAFAALPKNVLIGVKSTVSQAKKDEIFAAFQAKKLKIYYKDYIHTPTSNTWHVANFHTKQFQGNVSQEWIDTVLAAASNDPDVKVEFSDNPAQTLRDRDLKEKDSPY